jgi:hypothetical protein
LVQSLAEELPQEVSVTPFPTSSKPDTTAIPKKSSKKIGSPITSITPLQCTRGTPIMGWIFGEELTPITIEELPLNEVFFNKKRKAVVKKDLYREKGTVAKKFKILADGKDMKKEEFTTQIAGMLGDFSTSN